MRREGSFRQTAKQQLDGSIHAARSLAGRHDGALPAYERLLRPVQSRTLLLHSTGRARDSRTPLNAGLLALAQLGCHGYSICLAVFLLAISWPSRRPTTYYPSNSDHSQSRALKNSASLGLT
jgi:hypothetical protein